MADSPASLLATEIDRIFPQVQADLESLIRIPSISSEGPDTPAIRACADRVEGLFAGVGLTVSRLEVVGGPPVILAERAAAAGAPTVLLYAHYDVQPAGDPTGWTSPSFEPTERNGRLYGRGSSDDKAGLAMHLGALRALGTGTRVGIKVISEGEEEIGSPHMAEILERYGDRLAADVIVIADSEHWRVGAPALTTTQRGIADCIVEVRTLANGVHSGQFGGPIPDALSALVRLLATLHDDRGVPAIEGLAHAPDPTVEVPEDELRSTSGMTDGVSLIGDGPLAARLWTRPAISILAIDAPRVAEAINQLVPVARAKISVRTAPGDDSPRVLAALTRHLQMHTPWGAQVTVTPGATPPSFTLRRRGPHFDAFLAGMREAWGVEPAEIGIGGTIPLVSMLADRFPEASVLVVGVGEPTSRIHGPDESQDLGELRHAILAEALALRYIETL